MHYKNHSQLQLYISLFLKTSQDADHSVNKALNIYYFTLAFWCYFGLWFHFYSHSHSLCETSSVTG